MPTDFNLLWEPRTSDHLLARYSSMPSVADDYFGNVQRLSQKSPNSAPALPETDIFRELDEMLQRASPEVLRAVAQSEQYAALSAEIQTIVQQEIISLIKPRLIANRALTESVRQQIEFIKSAEDEARQEERRSLSEINDYMKNYSHLTFNEYKSIKEKTAKKAADNEATRT